MTESNTRKAYHVATAASDLVWGGEHGWENDEIGEHDLANALRRKFSEMQAQAKPVGDLIKRRTLTMPNGTIYPATSTIDLYVCDWTTDSFEVFVVVAGSVPLRFSGNLGQCIAYGQSWFDARISEGWQEKGV